MVQHQIHLLQRVLAGAVGSSGNMEGYWTQDRLVGDGSGGRKKRALEVHVEGVIGGACPARGDWGDYPLLGLRDGD